MKHKKDLCKNTFCCSFSDCCGLKSFAANCAVASHDETFPSSLLCPNKFCCFVRPSKPSWRIVDDLLFFPTEILPISSFAYKQFSSHHNWAQSQSRQLSFNSMIFSLFVVAVGVFSLIKLKLWKGFFFRFNSCRVRKTRTRSQKRFINSPFQV